MVEKALNAVEQNSYNVKHGRQYLMGRIKEIALEGTFMLSVMGFIIGRASILNMLSPFGVAFIVSVALIAGNKNVAVIGTSIIAGIMTREVGYETIQSIVSIMLSFVAIKLLGYKDRVNTLKAGVVAFTINFAVSLLMNLLTNGTFILYDTLMGLFNSTIIMALVYIYNFALPIIMDKKSRKVLSNEEMICIAILCAILISGLSDIYIMGVSFKVVMSVLIVILAAYGQGVGVGAAIGTTVGLITCISADQVPVIIGTYAFCGLLSGLFKDTGKVGVALGFIMADLIILFYLGGEQWIIGYKELASGIILFILLPSSIVEKFIPFMDASAKSRLEQQSYIKRMRDLVKFKISRMNDAIIELSKAMEENESSEKIRQNSEMNSLVSSIVDKTCADCDARNICWNRDFYRTYQNIFDMLDVVSADGKVDFENAPEELKKKCLRLGQLVKTTNYMFDIYKMNYKWRLKAREGRKVVGEQLVGVSKVLNDLSEEIRQDMYFHKDVEEELAVALDKEGLQFNDIVVMKDNANKYQVNLYKKACLGRRECIKDISPAVSKVLKKKMRRDKTSCIINEGSNVCYFKLVEAVKYQISTGMAREIKDKGGISGDNYSFIELDDGKYMMALSDGMGTGPTAAVESNCAITLLEKYLEAGFDKSTALKAINTAISLKSLDEDYATVDLAIADLYTGQVEIIKIGAASTYIKRTDGSIERINSTSLPIGILSSVDMESQTTKLSHGDLIIMVTDGVEQSLGDEYGPVSAIESIESRNPQQFAEELLNIAKNRSGNDIKDDMTVLVSKIWEVM
ncbi:stage II sporulation protein E [Oxobacter pfennigii]|uniref:Stage II sporulation protein E n=1 Tax=Oxobacter pfennigii TaxID=36849 RepID=A0A0P8W593_9CLOT|nr:stage II sporulation protein E [Oxobacter pfennigii]KPU42761.1 stage II sporulation protein E [Oxobacter pfennigii]